MKQHMLGATKRSLLQRLKVTHSARNTGNNVTIKKYQELSMMGEYLPKLTDKLLTPYLRDYSWCFIKLFFDQR